MINQADIKYFIELTKTQHLTRAAERLGITQPALSHCIKRIENELNTTLFLRSKKGMALTSAGQLLLKSSQNLIQSWDQLLSRVHDEEKIPKGLIRFGCHSAVAQYILPLFMKDFLKQYPRIDFELQHGLSRYMTEQVVSGVLDMAVAVNPIENPDLIIKEIYKDEVCLWKSKSCINIDVLICEPNLLQTKNIIEKMRKRKIEFSRIIESPSLEVIANLVSHGAGCGILPERVLNFFDVHKHEKIKDSPIFFDRICLVYKREFKNTLRGRILIDFLIKKLN
jgi:DNA-binding transcriptional LysR family regulator